MTKAFGPVVVVNPKTSEIERVHCNWCIFRTWRDGVCACRYADDNAPRPIPDPGATPDWCEMKAGAIRDATDMAKGVTHRVYRWSGRRIDNQRVIFEGIPSEAKRQFNLAARDAKRGTVSLFDEGQKRIAVWPSPSAGGPFA